MMTSHSVVTGGARPGCGCQNGPPKHFVDGRSGSVQPDLFRSHAKIRFRGQATRKIPPSSQDRAIEFMITIAIPMLP